MPTKEAIFYFNRIHSVYPVLANELGAPANIPLRIIVNGKSISNTANHDQREFYKELSKRAEEMSRIGIPDGTTRMYFDTIKSKFPTANVYSPEMVNINVIDKYFQYANAYSNFANQAAKQRQIDERTARTLPIDNQFIELPEQDIAPATSPISNPDRIILDLDSIPTAEKITEQKTRELESKLTEEKKIPVGTYRVNFDVEYQTRVRTKWTDNTTIHHGWTKVAEYKEYNEQKNLITSINTANAILNKDFYDQLGYFPRDTEVPCEHIKIPQVGSKKYFTAFLPVDTIHIKEDLNKNEYDLYNQLRTQGYDTANAIMIIYQQFRPRRTFEIARSPMPGYPSCFRYLGSKNLIITAGTYSIDESGTTTQPIRKRKLKGELDDIPIDLTADQAGELLYKLQGTQYGDQKGYCVPHIMKQNWKVQPEWMDPTGYTVDWIENYASEHKLSLLLIDSDLNIISRNVGDHDIMNHKSCLIGIIIDKHIYNVNDAELRKSLVERSKAITNTTTLHRYYDSDSDDEETEEEKAKKIITRQNMLADYKSKIECKDINELTVSINTPGTTTIYYNGNFDDAIRQVIQSNVDVADGGVAVIPSKKNLKLKKGKIVAIKFRDHWIKPINDEENIKIFEKCIPLIETPDFSHINPTMNGNELISGLRDRFNADYISIFNDHSLNFMDSSTTIELCRPLVGHHELFNSGIQNINSVDISKAFQVSSLLFGDYARYTGLEYPEVYNPLMPIDNIAFYHIERPLDGQNHPLYRGNGRYEGHAVKFMLNYKIIQKEDIKQVCYPQESVKSTNWESFIVEVNRLFGPDDAKSIINSTVGCMKPNQDKIFKNYCVTTDINIIHSRVINCKTGKPNISTIDLSGNKKLYVVSNRGEFNRYRSQHAMRMSIIDRLYCLVIEMTYKVPRPLFIKTDCIYYEGLCEQTQINLDNYINKLRSHFSDSVKALPEFGLLKYESKPASEYSFDHNVSNKNIEPFFIVHHEERRISVTNGADEQFLVDLETMNCALIEAPGGHGKTFSLLEFEKYLVSQNKKVLKCAFTNAVKLLTGGQTFHASFRMGFKTNKFYKIEKGLKEVADQYDVLLCDECSMITGDIYECLSYMRNYKPALKIYLYGNWRQCKPVEPGREVDYSSLGLVNWLVGHNYITFTKNYRVGECYEWAEYLKKPDDEFYATQSTEYKCRRTGEMKKYMTYAPSSGLLSHISQVNSLEYPINLAYTRTTCALINKQYMEEIAVDESDKIWVDIPKTLSSELVKAEHKQPIWLFDGLRLIGRKKVLDYTTKQIKAAEKQLKKNNFVIDNIDQDELLDDFRANGDNSDSYVNEHYKVEWFNTSAQTFGVVTNSDFHSYVKRATYKISDLHRFFNLGYCFTVHSVQGLTINQPYIIHEFSKMCFYGTEVLYTALSRATNPKYINLMSSTVNNMANVQMDSEFTIIDDSSSWMGDMDDLEMYNGAEIQESKSTFKSTFDEKSHYESFDHKKLDYIIQNEKVLTPILEHYSSKLTDSMPVIKQYFTNSVCEESSIGKINVAYHESSHRDYADHSLSLQSFPRIIRGCIADSIYHDVDMVNCQPTILNWLCKQHNIKSFALEFLVDKREAVFNLFSNDRETVKQAIIATINGSKYAFDNLKKNKWAEIFTADMKIISSVLFNIYKNDKRFEPEADAKNPIGQVVSSVCRFYENKLLKIMVDYFKTEGVQNNYVLCFDGLLVPKDIIQEIDSHLTKIEDAFVKKINIPMKLKCKPMTNLSLEYLMAEVGAHNELQKMF